jgi:hypothetical protein
MINELVNLLKITAELIVCFCLIELTRKRLKKLEQKVTYSEKKIASVNVTLIGYNKCIPHYD